MNDQKYQQWKVKAEAARQANKLQGIDEIICVDNQLFLFDAGVYYCRWLALCCGKGHLVRRGLIAFIARCLRYLSRSALFAPPLTSALNGLGGSGGIGRCM